MKVLSAPIMRGDETNPLTPDEAMRAAHRVLETQLGNETLDRILSAPPDFFERLVVKLLTAMGYEGSTAEAARVLVDGPMLTKLMIRHEVGCRIEETLYIKRIDEEFFE